MKKRKSIGFRWIGNRTVIGIVCMIAAIGICFGIAPTVQKLSAGKTTILRVTRTVPRGSCLTEADVETVEVGSYGLSRDILRDKTAVVGKYATTDIYAGEYLIPAKLTANGADANGILESLTVGKKAISVTLGSFAQGLSGKLETGDIVSVIVYKAKEGAAVTPPELQYLRVITSTTSQGVDKANITDSTQPVTVTLLVNQAQAELLSAYEKSASMHFALEYRGDAETAAQYLAVQEEYFRGGAAMSEKSGKLIAVWGSPHSGKTTFSASLATAIADTYAAATVFVLHSDIEAPMLSVLFPNAKSGSLGSVGIPLSANEPDTEQILANCTETKARPTLAVMGYRDGDTRLTYPRYGKERAVELFGKLKSLSDFVIVDCMSNPNESLLSLAALETASQTVRLCTPELPSISWHRTQKAVWGSAFPWADMNQGLNLTDNGNLPVEEAREQLGEVSFLLPYSKDIKAALSCGNLYAKNAGDRVWTGRMREIAAQVVGNAG